MFNIYIYIYIYIYIQTYIYLPASSTYAKALQAAIQEALSARLGASMESAATEDQYNI